MEGGEGAGGEAVMVGGWMDVFEVRMEAVTLRAKICAG